MQVEVKITDNIEAGLAKFQRYVQEEVLIAGVAATAFVFYEQARLNTLPNVKNWTLYNAIYRVYADDKSTEDRKVYRISWNRTKAPHGHFLEFGTSHSRAYPFIGPAFDRADDALKTGIARMAEKLTEYAP